MILNRSFLLLLLAFGHYLSLNAQNDYLVQRFTTDNGLPSNGIKGLQWDEETGFLWIATEAGVTRYNGADFMTFSKANTPELFSERMMFMMKNRQGAIYTADEAGNIFFVMQNKLQFMGRVKLNTRPSTVKLIGLVASGKMFRQSSLTPPDSFGFNYQSETLIPVSDTHIILSHRDSLYDYIAGKPEPLLITSVKPGSKVFYLEKQLFLFNPKDGFCQLDPQTGDPTPLRLSFGKNDPGIPATAEEKFFWESGMSPPILISGPRAWSLKYEDRRFIATLICTAVPTDAMLSYALYKEDRELLFLGTESRGIVMIRKNKVRPVKREPLTMDKTSSCYSQVALADGSVLVSQGDVLGGRPGPSLPIRGHFNNFILLTPDSLLWYSRGDTVCSYSYKTHRTTSCYAGAGSITDGLVRSGGKLYVANAIGIGVLQDGKIDYLYRYPVSNINNNVPFSMIELGPDQLAIASCNGLLRFNTRTLGIDTVLSLPGVCVRALWKYEDYLFIGTYGKGIFLWKKGILRSIPSDKNNYLKYAHCFIPDTKGFCWISTNKGLFRTTPGDMVNAFEKGLPEIYYEYYGRNDGMDITELNGGCTPCALVLKNSILSFPSMDGLVWVDPAKLATRSLQGSIYIDDMYADGKKVNIGSLLRPELPAATRELSFSLSFPAWVDKENIYIEYKLEPYSTEWQPLEWQDNPTLHFGSLPPGNYQLILRKLNGFGEKNYSFRQVSFRIMPHWYQQLWVWLLAACGLIGLFMWIVRLRTRQFQVRQLRLEKQIAEKTNELRQKNEELEKTDHIKTRLISIISHDLVTPLKFLHLAGKSLIEKKSQLSEELQIETVTEIMNTSKELELLSTNILNWIKYRNEDRRLVKENFSLHQMVWQLSAVFRSMAKQKHIRLINEVDEAQMIYQFIEPVKIVLYNLVLNGINFTSEGYIRISSSSLPGGVDLRIEDTGVGMTQDQINNILADHFIISSANVDNRKGNGLGYLIIKDLLKIIRGSLSIRSEKGKGTDVTIHIPV